MEKWDVMGIIQVRLVEKEDLSRPRLIVMLWCTITRVESRTTPSCFVFGLAGKIGGGASVARFFGMTRRESLAVGVLMNTRGLVELIILNIGLDAGVLTEVPLLDVACWSNYYESMS